MCHVFHKCQWYCCRCRALPYDLRNSSVFSRRIINHQIQHYTLGLCVCVVCIRLCASPELFVWVMFYFRCCFFFANTSCQRLLLRLCYRWPMASVMGICPSGCLALLNFFMLKLYVFVCIAEINILLLLLKHSLIHKQSKTQFINVLILPYEIDRTTNGFLAVFAVTRSVTRSLSESGLLTLSRCRSCRS